MALWMLDVRSHEMEEGRQNRGLGLGRDLSQVTCVGTRLHYSSNKRYRFNCLLEIGFNFKMASEKPLLKWYSSTLSAGKRFLPG